jgi:multiple sugar transport system substrate-binding protein
MNPKIKIKLIELPDDTNEKYEVLNSALALEDGSIDIIDSDVIWPAIFVEAGWVEPLGQYFGEN